MAPQKKKHSTNQLRPLYDQIQTRECPACKEIQSKVKESRRIFEGVRRRHECLKCDYRYTTYEISSDAYDELRSLRSKINQLHAVFSDLMPPVQQVVTKPVLTADLSLATEPIPCADCVHLMPYGCSFDIPEAQTEEARGCNLFQENTSATMLP